MGDTVTVEDYPPRLPNAVMAETGERSWDLTRESGPAYQAFGVPCAPCTGDAVSVGCSCVRRIPFGKFGIHSDEDSTAPVILSNFGAPLREGRTLRRRLVPSRIS